MKRASDKIVRVRLANSDDRDFTLPHRQNLGAHSELYMQLAAPPFDKNCVEPHQLNSTQACPLHRRISHVSQRSHRLPTTSSNHRASPFSSYTQDPSTCRSYIRDVNSDDGNGAYSKITKDEHVAMLKNNARLEIYRFCLINC